VIQTDLPKWPDRDQIPHDPLSAHDEAPIEFPMGVRMAQVGDEPALWNLFVKGHAENGFGEPDKDHVMKVFERACRGDGVVIAVIDGEEGIIGAIGFTPEKAWSANADPKNYYNVNLLFYVDSDHRHPKHARALVKFGEWWSQETGLPTMLGLQPKTDFERKKKFFDRFGPQIGAFYLIGRSSFPGGFIPS
jgi:hypothetical protein